MKQLYVVFYVLLGCCAVYMICASVIQAPKMHIASAPVDTKYVPVNRIVSLCKPVPMIVMGLDAGDGRLVGVNPETKLSMQNNILNKYFPAFQQLSGAVCNNAFEPNIEELIRLKPDLVLQWKRFAEKILEMQNFGFNVVGMEHDGSERAERDMVRILAGAIGRAPRADSILQMREAAMKKIKEITDPIPKDKRPRVIFVYNFEQMRIGGEKSYEHFCIELAGGRNMGVGLGVDRSVNIEQILVWDPEIIFIGGWRTNVTPDDLYNSPILKEVSAIRNRRVIKMPVWASNESVLTWGWMADILHPDLFYFDMRDEIRTSYAWQYHINLSEADIDKVLFNEQNAGSPLYDRFKQY